jgi:DNA-binding LacI/PurR family transcriptional regulator
VRSARGLSLVPRIADRDAALVHNALVDGFVVFSLGVGDPRLSAVRERRLPYVLVYHPPTPGVRQVNVDDRGGARAAIDHLVDLGHRRFGIVVGWDNPSATAAEAEARATYHAEAERLARWREGLEAAGLDWDAVQVASAPGFEHKTGRLAGLRLLDRAEPPTALVAFSDLLALGVLEAAVERGVAVPEQLSVVGFDDVPEAALAHAALTTLHQPHAAKGSEAVRLLLDGTDQPQTVFLPTQLVPRSTTAPAP